MHTPSLMPFLWHTYDLDKYLNSARGATWAEELIALAKTSLRRTPIIPRSTTSREADKNSVIQAAVVDGIQLKEGAPWLHRLYRTDFLALASRAAGQKASCAGDDIYGINLNVQIGSDMRYECHVDSNPIQGMLYITNHDATTGGELIVANNERAQSVPDVMADCVRIQPVRGRLIFFDARKHSHFVTSLLSSDGIRVAAAMNFYTASCPESQRPDDLSRHLGLIR